MHVQTGQTESAHETTRKKRKETNLQSLKKWSKTRKRENNRKITTKKKEKGKKKTEQEEQHEPKVPTSYGATKKQPEATKT